MIINNITELVHYFFINSLNKSYGLLYAETLTLFLSIYDVRLGLIIDDVRS